MCDATHPVFRSGTILRAQREIQPDVAIQIASVMRDCQEVVVEAFRESLRVAGFQVANFEPTEPASDRPQMRVRLFPAITIDFAPQCFLWRDSIIEFRPCMTVCVGGKRAKIWTRYNFRSPQADPVLIGDFFSSMLNLDAVVQTKLISVYNSKLSSFDNWLTREYGIYIRMLSARNESIKKIAEGYVSSMASIVPDPDDATTASAQRQEIFEIISAEFGNSSPLSRIEEDRERVDRRFVTFSYPRSDDIPLAETLDSGEKAPMLDYNAVCIVNIGDKGMDIVGVAFEERTPEDFRKSMPHIVSGEISHEIGNKY